MYCNNGTSDQDHCENVIDLIFCFTFNVFVIFLLTSLEDFIFYIIIV